MRCRPRHVVVERKANDKTFPITAVFEARGRDIEGIVPVRLSWDWGDRGQGVGQGAKNGRVTQRTVRLQVMAWASAESLVDGPLGRTYS